MNIDINIDPEDISKSAFSGRKWWQWLSIGIALVFVLVITIILRNVISSTVNGLLCAVVVVPFGYIGVFQKNGLDFFEYYRKKWSKYENRTVFLYGNDAPVYVNKTQKDIEKELANKKKKKFKFVNNTPKSFEFKKY